MASSLTCWLSNVSTTRVNEAISFSRSPSLVEKAHRPRTGVERCGEQSASRLKAVEEFVSVVAGNEPRIQLAGPLTAHEARPLRRGRGKVCAIH